MKPYLLEDRNHAIVIRILRIGCHFGRRKFVRNMTSVSVELLMGREMRQSTDEIRIAFRRVPKKLTRVILRRVAKFEV